MRLASVVLLACAVSAAPLRAQRADSLRIGAQVRVDRWQPVREFYRGTYQWRDSVTFVIARQDDMLEPAAIPIRDIGAVEMLVGLRTPGEAFRRGAGRGALVGIGGSAIVMTLAVIADARETADVIIPAKVVAGAFAVVLTSVTTLVGGAIGVAQREQWARVPFRP